jgi:hypothetical protein
MRNLLKNLGFGLAVVVVLSGLSLGFFWLLAANMFEPALKPGDQIPIGDEYLNDYEDYYPDLRKKRDIQDL